LEIQPGTVRLFLGNVSYYLDKKKEESELTQSAQKSRDTFKKVDAKESDAFSKKEKKRLEAERRNALSKRMGPLKKKIAQVETAIEGCETRLRTIEATMAEVDFYEDPVQVKETSIEYEKIKQELTELMFQWEEYQQRVEHIEAEFEQDA
jgi:ATP-binding cassette subfamily F protein 3